MRWSPTGRHGMMVSEKYTSEMMETFCCSGIQMWYAPGTSGTRPRFMPFQAFAGMTVLAIMTDGFMAYVLQPNGMIDMTLGTMPVTISYDDFLEPGGPVTRLRMSTAC